MSTAVTVPSHALVLNVRLRSMLCLAVPGA